MILTVIAALLLTAVPALADNGEKGDWELGLYGGHGWLDDYGAFHPKNDMLFGARAGYFFTPAWSLEGSWQRLDTETDLQIGGLPDGDMTLSCYRLNMLYNFKQGESFRPFVTAGVGCEGIDIDRFGDRSDVGFNVGGGLRWFLSPHFDMRLDGRFVRTPVGGDIDATQQNIEATFGVGWVFGGSPRASAPPAPAAVPTPDTDSDGDGVYDRTDRCSRTPRGWPVDQWGCPLDSDGDVVPDGVDLCPYTPRMVKVDDNGCPLPEAKVPLIQILRERKAVVLEGVEFDIDKDTLRPASLTTLDEVAASLKDWSDVRLEVQGHCSEPGTDAHNMDLSQRRAAAVKAYLVSRGIDASRLEPKGYGERRPIAGNETKAGRQLNRRVELHVIE
jgi:outer membrane protein OmpA-like peptidoglycan-associated protein/opacity protein-like surface antigen